MGTAVAGHRRRLMRLSRLIRTSAPGSSSIGRVSTTPGLQEFGKDVATVLGPDEGERPVVEGADATGRDVGVLGGEVGARVAPLPGEGVRLLEGDLVVAAVAHPDLEDALDVHLGDVLAGEAVARPRRARGRSRRRRSWSTGGRSRGRSAVPPCPPCGPPSPVAPTPGSPCRRGRSARHRPRAPRHRRGGWPSTCSAIRRCRARPGASGPPRGPPSRSCRRPRAPRPGRRR